MAGTKTFQSFLALLSFSSFYYCNSFLVGGGSNVDSIDPMQAFKKTGFEQDPQIYSHLVIPPWSRPFKLGYCLSWEWNTDVKYRQKRIDICNEHSSGKHECDSPSGFCKDRCPFTNGSYPFWRLRNADDVPFLWVISSLEFYETSFSKKSLISEPTKAYSSSYFGPGYKPSNAFDNNPDTLWVANGAAPPGMQWIAYEFPHPVFVGSIRIVAEEDKPERSPSMIYVEASCEKYFRNFVTQWVIHNPSQDADRKFNVFNVAKFTNLGGHGRYGPMSIGNHYHGQDHDGQVTVTNGIQMWKVPATGMYALEAAGASGGYDKFSAAAGKSRGRGARVKGNFYLTKGQVLKILVGQEGGVNTVSGGSGGGGGTFVFNQNTKKPLLVAGGGGGIDKMKTENARCHGTASNDGNSGYGGSQLRGGVKGKGAEDGDSGYSGGGGGGLNTDGRNNKNFGGARGTGGEGGLAFRNGGYGGRSNQNNVEGGFGGGGGPNGAGGGGGGGGGYSGGASGSRSNSCGGGGGSFNSGKDQSNQGGVNVGHGYVVVKLLSVK